MKPEQIILILKKLCELYGEEIGLSRVGLYAWLLLKANENCIVTITSKDIDIFRISVIPFQKHFEKLESFGLIKMLQIAPVRSYKLLINLDLIYRVQNNT